jgi:hypothetical protein
LGRVHRYFIDAGNSADSEAAVGAGLCIKVNDDTVPAINPLQLNDDETEIILDDSIPITITDNDVKRTENVRVRIVLVAESHNELEVGKSLKSQGFYVMRNQREVMNAVALNFFTKHNDFNRMRGEIFFPGTLDKWIGIEFTKRQVEFEQSVHDQLAITLSPICRTIKRREATKKRVQTGEAQARLHLQAVKAITEKEKLLIKPDAIIERRTSPKNNGRSNEKEPVESDTTRSNFSRTQSSTARLEKSVWGQMVKFTNVRWRDDPW